MLDGKSLGALELLLVVVGVTRKVSLRGPSSLGGKCYTFLFSLKRPEREIFKFPAAVAFSPPSASGMGLAGAPEETGVLILRELLVSPGRAA